MTGSLTDIPVQPLDEAFAITKAFNADPSPLKVSLGAGVYRDDNSKPWVLPSVKKAKERLHARTEVNHEYLPIQGYDAFLKLARELILGATLTSSGNLVSFQTISGTGANHLGALFLAQQLKPRNVFISNPTWANHHLIWTIAAPEVCQQQYPYWDPVNKCLDFDGWMKTLEEEAVENDVVILHACAHNPTGVDPTQSQWQTLVKLFQRKKLFAFFDSAYQGFATGDLEKDAWAVRHFQETLMTPAGSDWKAWEGPAGMCIAQSFAKNFGLYGERVGALHLSLPTSVSTAGAYSQMLRLIRAEISNPPLFGARLVEIVLSDPELREEWKQDLKEMSSRIIGVRKILREHIEADPVNGDWSHLTSQIGMFSYTGLSEQQVLRLTEEHHIYLMRNGRASLSGVNQHNAERVAKAIGEVISYYRK